MNETDEYESSAVNGIDEQGSPAMKYFCWLIAVAVVLTVLAVLFVPGVDDWVEQTVQRYVGRAAR